jgi:hypothetical protein
MKQKTTHFRNLSQFPPMAPLEDAAKSSGLALDRLRELAEAGYAPHYRVDGGPLMFRLGELKAWIKENLTHAHAGMPLPKSIPVWVEHEKLGECSQPPMCLRGVERLHQAMMPPKICGIYFLCSGPELVYVGQSVDVYTRIVGHRDTKEFDRVFYLSVPRSELDRIEGAFIRALRPCLNGNVGPTTDDEARRLVAQALGERQSA